MSRRHGFGVGVTMLEARGAQDALTEAGEPGQGQMGTTTTPAMVALGIIMVQAPVYRRRSGAGVHLRLVEPIIEDGRAQDGEAIIPPDVTSPVNPVKMGCPGDPPRRHRKMNGEGSARSGFTTE